MIFGPPETIRGQYGHEMGPAVPVGVSSVAAAVPRIASRFAGRLLPAVASTGGELLPATTVRVIQHGENVAGLQAEVAQLTYVSGGLEHAIISLQSGARLIVSGGSGGIQFGSDLRRVIMHTHSSSTGPSAIDFLMLEQTGQRHSYIYELFGGGRTRFDRR
jgi:hypothetical protein